MFLRPGLAETTFSGTVFAGFLQGSGERSGHELRIDDYRIAPGTDPPLIAVSGRVVSRPGEYIVTISLAATVPGHVSPYDLSTTIPVRILSPSR